MVHRQRRGGGGRFGDRAQRNFVSRRAKKRRSGAGIGILPVLRRRFHHHVILIQRRVHGGHLALAEGVVERVVDQLRRNAEARRGLAVVVHHRLQTPVLLIAVDVGDDAEWFSAPPACAARRWSDRSDCRRAWCIDIARCSTGRPRAHPARPANTAWRRARAPASAAGAG